MLKVATYNIHKGFSPLNRRVVLHELRERLHELNADIVFLQEVQGSMRITRNSMPIIPICRSTNFWPIRSGCITLTA